MNTTRTTPRQALWRSERGIARARRGRHDGAVIPSKRGGSPFASLMRRWAITIIYIAASCFFAPVANAAIAYVQTTDVNSQNTTATTIAKAFPGAVTGGNLIVCAVAWGTTTTATVADTLGNSYLVARPRDNIGNLYQEIFYAKNITGGAAPTVTATFAGGGAQFRKIQCNEYSGLDTASPLDVSAGQGVNLNTNPTSGTTSMTNSAAELIFGAVYFNATASAVAGAGFTVRGTPNFFEVEDRIVAATGTYAANWGTISPADTWTAQVATFKAASCGPTFTSTAAGGNWSAGTTWVGGCAPALVG